MRDGRSRWTLVLLLGMQSGIVLAQGNTGSRTLVVNGQSTEGAVVQINNRSYADLETLARLANGTLSFQGSHVTLQLPCPSAGNTASTSTPEPAQPVAKAGLSRNFMIAGIETLAQMREWGSAMAYAIQNGYGVTASWAADYREKAASSLSMASSAATTDSDHNALQLLTNEFNNVSMWSDQLVQAKQSMDTAQYSTSPGTLRNEPLSQKIIRCGRFLGTMLGSAEFKDDASCH
jgi:hypothetical protein